MPEAHNRYGISHQLHFNRDSAHLLILTCGTIYSYLQEVSASVISKTPENGYGLNFQSFLRTTSSAYTTLLKTTMSRRSIAEGRAAYTLYYMLKARAFFFSSETRIFELDLSNMRANLLKMRRAYSRVERVVMDFLLLRLENRH